jgi:hypothetical protein
LMFILSYPVMRQAELCSAGQPRAAAPT